MKKKLYITFFIVLYYGIAKSQDITNIREKFFSVLSDTIKLDTLSIFPQTVFLFDNTGKLINDSLYSIDYSKSLLFPSKELKNNLSGNIRIAYKVLPMLLSRPIFNKDIKFAGTLQNNNKPYTIVYDSPKNNSFFDKDELIKKGSISRGISFGNNQDMIVNSNLNLQLSGKIGDNLYILAAISDNNIPIQPDGNTQQIQEFDKVFVQLYNKTSKLIIGDYELNKPKSYFMNLAKKVQGGMYNTELEINKEKQIKLQTLVSGAVSKGKYNKMEIKGIEGNQGPYKLTGAENENYIIILAGTEKIYIDGKLLKRGQENDYTIDYNTGELKFTTNQLLTKDKRITAEFQYSDKNYVRFLFYNANEIKNEKGSLRINFFSEQDSKNQPLDQSLTDEQKNILQLIGDSINNAISPRVDSIAFQNDMVLYKRIDTTVNNVFYDSIFVYSINPDSAFYRVGFSFVGNGNGNYKQDVSTANGRVYKWIAPIAGIKQGSYEPVVLLITPKKKQMLTIGGDYRIKPFTRTFYELAATNNDINTFSTKNKSNDFGYAVKAGIAQEFFRDTTKHKLTGIFNFQIITAGFDPVEQYRDVEFTRDWNLSDQKMKNIEQFYNLNFNYFKNKAGSINYSFDRMQRDNTWEGLKNGIDAKWKYKGFQLKAFGNILFSKDTINSTRFIRHSASFSHNFKYFVAGIKEEQEQNKWSRNSDDTLLLNSFAYQQYETFVKNPDSSKMEFFANYKHRDDYKPKNNELLSSSSSDDINAGLGFTRNPLHTFKISASYRELKIKDTLLSFNKPENTVAGKTEYSLQKFKGALVTSVFYELGSGLEVKKEFTYIEVARGQGVYTWTDYNENNIKEINEFELANYQDQANYIRVYTPTSDYIKTYSNLFNAVINLRPEKIWSGNTGLKKFISRFSNQFALKLDKKTSQDKILSTANPFTNFGTGNIADSNLISLNSTMKNLFSFNKTNPVFGADILYQETRNKLLLVNGFDTREHIIQGIRTRWNLTKKITWLNTNDFGNKKYESEFFSEKNYHIPYLLNETNLSYQPGMSLRISIIYKYTNKINKAGSEKMIANNVGTEIKYNSVKKGSLVFTINYINIAFNSSEDVPGLNTPVAYEMLESLLPGNNASWSVQFQRNLTNVLQMNLNYTGRISEGAKAIHTGGVQLRAVF